MSGQQTAVVGGRGLMQIGELADRVGLSHRTIRHYDEQGLLNPTTRSVGGFRLYSDDDLNRLLLIRRMKPLGYSIDQMRDLLDAAHHLAKAAATGQDDPPARARLSAMLTDVRERREALRRQLIQADEFVAHLEDLENL